VTERIQALRRELVCKYELSRNDFFDDGRLRIGFTEHVVWRVSGHMFQPAELGEKS
jgi:hypothetical protein